MDRRRFFTLSGVGALALAGGQAAVPPTALAQSARRGAAGARPVKFKLGCQSGPSTDDHFAYFARYGVKNICAAANVGEGRLYPTVAELTELRERAERHGLSLDMLQPVLLPSSHIDRERNSGIMLGAEPQRQREIEAFQTTLRNCQAAGIPAVKYNMSLLGVVRMASTPGRGDTVYSTWKYAAAKPATPLTKAGPVNADAYWERITYFLDHVAPVANETKVRIACHPHDPGMPPEGYQGVDTVLGTVDGLKRFVSIRENPYHGLNFCQGTVSEMLQNPGEEIFDVIRYFGSRKKIFNVHFRNIKGHRGDFVETFPDIGDINFVKAMRTYQEVGYDGMLQPDHVPTAKNDPEGLQSFAFAYGYIRGLMQSLENAG